MQRGILYALACIHLMRSRGTRKVLLNRLAKNLGVAEGGELGHKPNVNYDFIHYKNLVS